MSLINNLNSAIDQLFRKIKYPINVFEKEVTDIKISNENIKRYRFQKLKKDFFSISLKSKDDSYKYLFYILMVVLLFFLPIWSLQTGISDAEIAAQKQAEALYNYYAHHDQTITTLSEAKHHPQFVDFICCCITQWFHIDSVYHFRHLVGSLFAWFIIVLAGSFLMNLFHWRTAFFGAIFLFISPHFIGQSFGNLVDIPFAFFYLLTLYHTYVLLCEFPIIKWKRLLLITLSIIAATYIHSGGYVLLHYLYLFTILIFLVRNPIKKIFTKQYVKNFLFLLTIITGVTVVVYIFNLIIPPFSHPKTGILPTYAIADSTLYQKVISFLWEGHIVSSDSLSWKFILQKMQITVPLIIIIGTIIHILFLRSVIKEVHFINELLIIVALIYPLWSLQGSSCNLGTGWSIYLMSYPLLVIYAAAGYEGILQKVDDRYTNVVIVGAIILLIIMPLRHTLLYTDSLGTYFNEISGGIRNAQGKYAIDPEESCNQRVCNWLIAHTPALIYVDTNGHYLPYVVATNGNDGCDYFLRHSTSKFQLLHADWNTLDTNLLWDYYISFIDQASETEIQQKLLPQDTILYQIKVEKQPIAHIIKRNYQIDTLIFVDSLSKSDSLIAIE